MEHDPMIEDWIQQGMAKIEKYKAEKAAAAKAAAESAEAERQHGWDVFKADIAKVIPTELHRYLVYDDEDAGGSCGTYKQDVQLQIPELAPMSVWFQNSNQGWVLLYGDGARPWQVEYPHADRDVNAEPFASWGGRSPYETADMTLALAAAHIHYLKFLELQDLAAQEELELKAKRQREREDEERQRQRDELNREMRLADEAVALEPTPGVILLDALKNWIQSELADAE